MKTLFWLLPCLLVCFTHFREGYLLNLSLLGTVSHVGPTVQWNNSLLVSRYCIVETGKVKQSWAAADRLSASGEFYTLEDSACQSVSGETSHHG